MSVPNTRTSGVRKAVAGVVATVLAFLGLLHLSAFPPTLRAADAATQPSEKPATEPLGPEAPIAPATIKEWFADLANSDAAVRSDALTKLMSLQSDDLPILKKIVEDSRPLAPAQATVLRQIVTQVFLSGEPYEGHPGMGFLGVKPGETGVGFRELMSGEESAPKTHVVITETIPGFGGAKVLREGDVILSVLERPDAPVTNYLTFTNVLGPMGAGARVHFQILRQGRIMQVAATLMARPIEADQGLGMPNLLEQRRERIEDYWATEFAALVRDGAS